MRYVVLPVLCISLAVAEAGDSLKPPESLTKEELTAEVQRLRTEVESLNARIERLHTAIDGRDSVPQSDDPADAIRLPGDVQAVFAHFSTEKTAVWKRANGKIRELRQQAAASLQDVQDRYTRDAKLDEAVAIRDAIRALRQGWRKALPDPGALRVADAKPRTLFFRVTGSDQNTVWGTDVYTSDSWLATAAVHAGVLKLGQTAIVRVTTIPSHTGFASSTRHGITSQPWSTYAGFRVELPGDEDEEGADEFDGQPEPERGRQPEAALPADARQQVERFETAAAAVRNEARQQVARLGREAIRQLGPLQEKYTRAGQLDEAVAARDLIRKLAANTGAGPDRR